MVEKELSLLAIFDLSLRVKLRSVGAAKVLRVNSVEEASQDE
jgi:hypothetical protein